MIIARGAALRSTLFIITSYKNLEGNVNECVQDVLTFLRKIRTRLLQFKSN